MAWNNLQHIQWFHQKDHKWSQNQSNKFKIDHHIKIHLRIWQMSLLEKNLDIFYLLSKIKTQKSYLFNNIKILKYNFGDKRFEFLLKMNWMLSSFNIINKSFLNIIYLQSILIVQYLLNFLLILLIKFSFMTIIYSWLIQIIFCQKNIFSTINKTFEDGVPHSYIRKHLTKTHSMSKCHIWCYICIFIVIVWSSYHGI